MEAAMPLEQLVQMFYKKYINHDYCKTCTSVS